MRPIAIPRKFYDDHVERDLPAPPIIKKLDSGKTYIIDGDSEHLDELVNDAEYYADPAGPSMGCASIKAAARKLLWHIENA